MDVAYYLSELLGQQGEVNVPGLGNFTQQKIDGYYDNEERTFYPPGSEVHFNTHFVDDDKLAEYVAEQKRISLASSKYFIEKFVNGLKAQVMIKDVQFAELGWLHFEETGIAFKSAGPLTDSPSFFGYPKIHLEKLGGTSFLDQMEAFSMVPKDEIAPPILQDGAIASSGSFGSEMEDYLRSLEADTPIAEPQTPVAEPEQEPVVGVAPTPEPVFIDPEPYVPPAPIYETPIPEYIPPAPVFKPAPPPAEEEEFVFDGKGFDDVDTHSTKRSYKWLWITLLIIAVLGAAAYFIIYKRQQSITKFVKASPTLVKPALKQDTAKVVPPADSLKDSTQNAVIKDTTLKVATPPVAAPNNTASAIDSTKVRYEIIGSSANTLREANTIIRNYKSLNIDAHIAENVFGRKLKISLGTYMRRAEAVTKQKELLQTGKVQKDIYIQPINPKK